MKHRKRIWLASSVLVFIVFMWGIPLGVYAQSSFAFDFIGAALLFICLFQFFGDFISISELTEKENKRDVPGRAAAPFMVIPGFLFIFVLLINFNHRESSALASEGVLVKGQITNGESSTTTRRFQSSTSYSVHVVFKDSSGKTYRFDETVSAGEFHDAYQGAEVDVVYWRKDPRVAKAVLNTEELSTYKKVPDEIIRVADLITILEEKIPEDSINTFLNAINYEWKNGEEPGNFENEKLNQAIRYNKEKGVVIFVLVDNYGGYGIRGIEEGKPTFEKDLIEQGYKKQASSGEDGKAIELYYSDKYLVQKTTKTDFEPESGVMHNYEIFYVGKVQE